MKQMIYDERDAKPRSCHSSTIAALPNGELFATWFAGSGEGEDDVAIWSAYKSPDQSWRAGRLFKIREGTSTGSQYGKKDYPHWNPVVAHYGGQLNLFFKVGPSPRNWWTYLSTLKDDKNEWSKPKKVNFGPVKNKPILMSDGNMVCGHSTEDNYKWKSYIQIFSQDNQHIGTSDITVPKDVGLIQPTIWESAEPGHIHAMMRSNVGLIYRADSDDFGRTWTKAYPTNMPNNNSGIDVIYDRRRELLLMVWNPIWSPAISARRRGILSIVGSHDNGYTWHESLKPNLEWDAGEYSYPAIIEKDGDYHITHTWNRTNIAYHHIRNNY